jgi:small subunit ribosomal protein S18
VARGGGSDRDRRRSPKDSGRRTAKKKVCVFCSDHIKWVDYKDVNLLRRFMSDRGKIRARRVSGNCAQHQRDVAVAIKTARELALLPYSQRTVAERGGGRGRGSREDRGMGPREDRGMGPREDRDMGPRPEVEVAPNGEGDVDDDLVIVEGEAPGRAEPPAADEIAAEVEAGEAE